MIQIIETDEWTRGYQDEIIDQAKKFAADDTSTEAEHYRFLANNIRRNRRAQLLAAKVQAEREAQRALEDGILVRAAKLNPRDTSDNAELLRAVAEQINDHRDAGHYTTLHHN